MRLNNLIKVSLLVYILIAPSTPSRKFFFLIFIMNWGFIKYGISWIFSVNSIHPWSFWTKKWNSLGEICCCVNLIPIFIVWKLHIYIYIFQFLTFFLNILLKKNYTKHYVSRLITILSSPNSLNNFKYLYTYIIVLKHQLNRVYWLMRIERSETICINEYENWEAVLIIAL